jgi:3-dehydroquinate synthase
MSLIKLYIKTGNQKYPIFIGNNILNKLRNILKENLINFNQCLVIADKNVPKKLIDKVLNSLPQKKNIPSLF